ncbi:hypothetical protein INR49_028914 [Caranx melampygus]|nr:hypothetical protein INR49_028914 [Caranx melampygus]
MRTRGSHRRQTQLTRRWEQSRLPQKESHMPRAPGARNSPFPRHRSPIKDYIVSGLASADGCCGQDGCCCMEQR